MNLAEDVHGYFSDCIVFFQSFYSFILLW